jgi:two-component system cell cycle sensor histidine kinase/response regulator CckA
MQHDETPVISEREIQRTVLIVDDDIDFADSLADILDLNNYVFFIAHDRSQALELIRLHKIDVVLLDIRLGSQDGVELLDQLKKGQPDLLCIIITAFAALETAIISIQRGAYAYLRKPIEANELLTTLDRCFEKICLQRQKDQTEKELKLNIAKLEKLNQRLQSESQKASEAIDKLRLSESRYRDLFRNAPVGLLEVDLSQAPKILAGLPVVDRQALEESCNLNQSIMPNLAENIKIIDANEQTLRLFEAGNIAALRSGFKDIIASDGFCLLKDVIVALKSNRAQIEGETCYETLGGNLIHILSHAYLDAQNPSLDSVLISYLDITQRKLTENELKGEKEKFKVLVDESPMGICIMDDQGVINYINPKHYSIFGHTLDECPTLESWLRIAFATTQIRKAFLDEWMHDLEQAFNGQPVVKTFKVVSKDNTQKTVLFRTMPLKGGAHLILSEDISHQIRLEEQIVQAQKMEAVGTLAGGIAHDFNNLLQAIQGYSQLLLIDKSDQDPEADKLKEIVLASQRASELTRQLLTFSRKVESKLRPVDLNQIIRQTHTLLERSIPKMISMELDLQEQLDVVSADPVQIEQVLMNMAIDARDAMPDGGKIILRTANITYSDGYCRQHLGTQPGPHVEMSISDTGHGMDAETKEHIFEPFYTTKGQGKGTGLGLSMAYGIIKNHGGHIRCDSDPGVGTTFTIHLPSIEKSKGSSMDNVSDFAPLKGTETILLVDDESLQREIGMAILSKFGYQVLTCPDGESALAIYADKHQTIDLVLLDLIMPGMGGKQCLKEILKFNPKANIVIASGLSGDDESVADVQSSATGFINKPYKINQMLNVIRDILDKTKHVS